jgi:hypothetical protein
VFSSTTILLIFVALTSTIGVIEKVRLATPGGTSKGDELSEVVTRFRLARKQGPGTALFAGVMWGLHAFFLPLFWYMYAV